MPEQELLTLRRRNRLERATMATARRLWWAGELSFSDFSLLLTRRDAFSTLVDHCNDITPQLLTDEGEGDVPGFPLLRFLWEHRQEILEFILAIVKLFGGT